MTHAGQRRPRPHRQGHRMNMKAYYKRLDKARKKAEAEMKRTTEEAEKRMWQSLPPLPPDELGRTPQEA